MSGLIEKLLTHLTYYRLMNQWVPGFILEVFFLIFFYDPYDLNEISLGFFGVEPLIIFVILFLCGGAIFGFGLVATGGPVTYLINEVLFGKLSKISLADSDKIDELLVKENRLEIYHAVEDYNIIQVFLAELGLISLLFSILALFTDLLLMLLLGLTTIVLFFLNFAVGWIMVRKYENLAYLLGK